MKNRLHKYWLLVLIVVAVVFVLGFAIVVEIFRTQGYWIAEQIFIFLNSWAVVLGAAATVTLAAAAFWTVRITINENRRIRDEDRGLQQKRHAIDTILRWVHEIRLQWTRPSSSERVLRYEELYRGLNVPMTESLWMVDLAEFLGKEHEKLVRKARRDLSDLRSRLSYLIEKKDEEGRYERETDTLWSSLDIVEKAAFRLKRRYRL